MTIIRRYKNRKLYDSRLHKYVNNTEILSRIRQGEKIVIVNHKTLDDITKDILWQALTDEVVDVSLEKIQHVIIGGGLGKLLGDL